jgi:hypothetical protein
LPVDTGQHPQQQRNALIRFVETPRQTKARNAPGSHLSPGRTRDKPHRENPSPRRHATETATVRAGSRSYRARPPRPSKDGDQGAAGRWPTPRGRTLAIGGMSNPANRTPDAQSFNVGLHRRAGRANRSP